MSEELDISVEEATSFIDKIDLTPADWKAYKSRSLVEKVSFGTYVINLRMKGWSFRKIAEHTGMSKDTAMRYRNLAYEHVAEPLVRAELQESLERLDEAIEAVWDKVLTGDPAAIGAYLKIEERKAKLLGMDAAIKTENINVELTPQELEIHQLIQEAKEQSAAEELEILDEAPADV